MSAEISQGECIDSHRALAPSDLDAMCVTPENELRPEDEIRKHREAIARLETQALERFRPAAELFGENFLGPKQFEATFGFVPENIPDVPFSLERLEKAKALGMMLVLHIDKTSVGKPLSMQAMNAQLSTSDEKLLYDTHWYESEAFYTAAPRLGWKLVAKEPLPGSENRNAVQQLERIVTWLKEKVFQEMEMPPVYTEAIAEFDEQETDITSLMNSDNEDQWSKASDKIAKLQLAQLTLPTPSELIQTIAVHHKASGEYLLPNVYARTATPPDSNGSLVYVGKADVYGAWVYRRRPGYGYSNLGALPSLQS